MKGWCWGGENSVRGLHGRQCQKDVIPIRMWGVNRGVKENPTCFILSGGQQITHETGS